MTLVELAKFAALQEDIPDMSESTKRLAETKATLIKTIALITSVEVSLRRRFDACPTLIIFGPLAWSFELQGL
jgi:hypothetical protein